MNLNPFFKSLVDVDRTSIVICDLNHVVIYMNPAAIASYSKRGGEQLIGQSIFDCHNPDSVSKIKKVIGWFEKDKNNNIVHTFYNEAKQKDVYMIALRDETGKLIGYYEKHEFRKKDDMPFYQF